MLEKWVLIVVQIFPNSGTIGKTKCCAIDLDTAKEWCTVCDNTHPPSNCGPSEPLHTKGGDNVNPKDNGGVLSQNDDTIWLKRYRQQ